MDFNKFVDGLASLIIYHIGHASIIGSLCLVASADFTCLVFHRILLNILIICFKHL